MSIDYKLLGIWKVDKPWKTELVIFVWAICGLWVLPSFVAALLLFELRSPETHGWRAQLDLALFAAKRGMIWGLRVYAVVVLVGITAAGLKKWREKRSGRTV